MQAIYLFIFLKMLWIKKKKKKARISYLSFVSDIACLYIYDNSTFMDLVSFL